MRMMFGRSYMVTGLAGLLASWGALAADAPQASRQQLMSETVTAPGVALRELIGRHAAAPDDRSSLVSVALFRLQPGHGSAWSHNRAGEDAFLVLTGQGTIWIGAGPRRVGPGSYSLVQPATVRSVRADRGEALAYDAITAAAWSQTDDLLVAPPAGAPGQGSAS